MVRKPFLSLHFYGFYQTNYEVKLWGDWDDGKPIADPYYGDIVSQFVYCSSYSNAYRLIGWFRNLL